MRLNIRPPKWLLASLYISLMPISAFGQTGTSPILSAQNISVITSESITPKSAFNPPELKPKAKPRIQRIIKAPPSFKNIYHVKASQTPSGFQVPRFVSLKFGKVNGRTGPSRDHPIAWQYQRRGLPLLVVAETEMWRKVRDIAGDESWVRKPALSGEKYVLTLDSTALHAKPKSSARVTAQSDPNAVLKLDSCTDTQWCKVIANNGLKGWVERHRLWGAEALN